MAALTEEQELVRDQARHWANERAPVRKFRELRDRGIDAGFERDSWREMVDVGWTGIVVPEAYGGSDLGYLTFGLVLEELGRQLCAGPLFASGLVGASALRLAGNEAQKQELFPQIVNGEAIITLAVDEGVHHRPQATGLRAERTAGGFRLSGEKTFVFEGLVASMLVVAARTAGGAGEHEGLTLFLVPSTADGVEIRPMRAMDSRGYARVAFEGVEVARAATLGEQDAGADLLDAILDRARAGLCADMLGTGAQAFDMTLEFLQTRKQFGRIIGSFQALGHRAAGLFSAKEMARSCCEAALQAIDDEASNVAERASLAKATVGAFLFQMSNELIQMHGGIGMTDEFDAGLYLKRARVLEAAFGNRAYHRDRYARLTGF